MTDDLEQRLADPKPRRIVDETYREHIRGLPCLICGMPAECHHTTSRGAGGGDDTIIPLCHPHHMQGETEGWDTWHGKHFIHARDVSRVLWASWEKMQNE